MTYDDDERNSHEITRDDDKLQSIHTSQYMYTEREREREREREQMSRPDTRVHTFTTGSPEWL